MQRPFTTLLFSYVGLEPRETPALGKIFFLDFLLHRTLRELDAGSKNQATR
jgi:hypothetical protein